MPNSRNNKNRKNVRKKRNRRQTNRITLNYPRVFLAIFILLLSIVFISFAINKLKYHNSKSSKDEDISISSDANSDSLSNDVPEGNSPNKQDTTITMAFTGDIMCHNTMFKDAYKVDTKEYDFSYFFDDIKYHLQTPDITVGNLETTFAGSKIGYSGYPTFNTPETLAKTLKNVGFDVVSTANNHCIDKGYSGIESTINYLDEADIAHTGTYKSKESQDTILVKNVKGINIAFLSFTYGTNGIKIPDGKEYCVNLNDQETILSQLELAKQTNSDLICVCMHWGVEYQTKPNNEQKQLADFLIKNGVDLIIGNHPHVPQNMELRKVNLEDGTEKEAFVIYSLGNFMADQNKAYTRDSLILNLKYTKSGETGKMIFNCATYTPTYVYKNTSVSSRKFKILDMSNSIEKYKSGYDKSIGEKMFNTLNSEIENVRKIVGNEIYK